MSLGHRCKFQQVSRLGSVTARHSSSGRQPNCAVLNRGRHLYSAGWPSRWALAHIQVTYSLVLVVELYVQHSNISMKLSVVIYVPVLVFTSNCKRCIFHSEHGVSD